MRVRAPGKVMLAGEYAVLLPRAQALVAAVDRGLEVFGAPADGWSIRSKGVSWEEGRPVDEKLAFAVEALRRVREAFPGVAPQALETFDGMHDEAGRKLGLGGSAAVTVAVALAANAELPREKLWRLADEAHRHVQGGRGSGADVAACVFGGVIHYERAPRRAIRLDVHPQLRILLAWTGESARTAPRVALFEALAARERAFVESFVERSNAACVTVRNGLRDGNPLLLREGFDAARHALLSLERMLGVELETRALEHAVAVAREAGGAAKLSGAGGGDCAVVVALAQDVDRIEQALETAGAHPVRVELAGGAECL